MKEYYADKKCLNILRIAILAVTVAVNAVASYFLAFVPTVMVIVCTLFTVSGLFVSLIYMPVYFKHMKYRVYDDRIVKESGFYYIKKQSLIVSKIQYTTTYCVRIKSITGLNCVILHAYGGMMSIMFVSNRDFSEITYNLKV